MEVGDKIDNYVITEVLSGGMSEIYRVSDGLNRYVLKCVKENANEEKIRLFKREIRILKSLKHPNIIDIVADTYGAPKPYYVMPNCGKTFVDLAYSQVTELELLEYAIQFCEAIYYAHEQGIFHRDIKPQNVLLYRGIVKVSDFGLSRFVNRDTTTMTQTGMKAGTSGYMPPEYSNGVFKDGTIESDVYMIGKTLYYVFSHGKDVSNVRAEMVPSEMYIIIDRCTRDAPAQRYSSVGKIISDLKKYKDLLLSIKEAPKTIKEIKRNYQVNTSQFNIEVFKTLRSLGSNPMDWGDSLKLLGNTVLSQVLNYNRDSIVSLSLHFLECLSNPSDYIQFNDIDEYAEFVKLLVHVNTDETIKQNLISFMLDMSIDYNRYYAMKIVVNILNEQIELNEAKYRIYVMSHLNRLQNICSALGNDSEFNTRIKVLLKEQ